MTNKQKTELAWYVMQKMGNIVEFWGEDDYCDDSIRNLSPEEVQKQIAIWARRLPTDSWDLRLGNE